MNEEEPQGVAALVAAADAHDAGATDRLFVLLYGELQRLAQQQLQRMGGQLTLGPGTLLHETYLKLAGRGDGVAFPDRARFMGYAARAMRGLVIDYARRRQARKRGGGIELCTLPAEIADGAAVAEPLARLDEALTTLAQHDAELAELVDLKYFGGLSFTEIAALRNVTERTVYRHWEKARSYLFLVLDGDGAALFDADAAPGTATGTRHGMGDADGR